MRLKSYNALKNLAVVRKGIVATVPEDIELRQFMIQEEEKELLYSGIPLVRACVISIYESVITHARDSVRTIPLSRQLKPLTLNQHAKQYLDTVFLMLLAIVKNGVYVHTTGEYHLQKEKLQSLSYGRRDKVRFQPELAIHFSDFMDITYLFDEGECDWKGCNQVIFCFQEVALAYALQHMIRNGLSATYFPYCDLRMYSLSGSKEKKDTFPTAIRKSILGEKKYRQYGLLKEMIRHTFPRAKVISRTCEEYGIFQIIDEYSINLPNTKLSIDMKERGLALEIQLDYLAFEKLSEIIGMVSDNTRQSILQTPTCHQCPLNCKRIRVCSLEKEEDSLEVLTVCKCALTQCRIEKIEDLKSVEILLKHMLKYSIKKNIRRVK